MGPHEILALIDTGSEISLISAATAQKAKALKIYPRLEGGRIHMADGTTAELPGSVVLPIRVFDHTLRHEFHVLPTLDSDLLIGTDLWARLRVPLPPPPIRVRPDPPAASPITAGLAKRTPQEERELRQFLQEELRKFETVRGPTNQTMHRIRVKTDTPIKQRYRPRNPAMQQIIDDEVRAMENEGIIEPSTSAWSSPIVIVKKKTENLGFASTSAG